MVNPGNAVLVFVPPGIVPKQLDVRAAPFFVFARGRFDQHFEPFVHRRVTVHVKVESFQGVFELGDIGLGGADLRVVLRAYELGDDRGGQKRRSLGYTANEVKEAFDAELARWVRLKKS